jgi:hypothetical protein
VLDFIIKKRCLAIIMHLSHEKVKQQYSSNLSLDISTNSLYTTNSIYITNIWEEPMPRCILCKATTTERLCWRSCCEKQAWYEANKWKEGKKD